nr:ArsR [Bacillaceae bacterium JMAK1]
MQHVIETARIEELETYKQKFKALADTKRLHLLNVLSVKGKTCVCELTEDLELSQSKLSYHLRVLMDAGLLIKETQGTWSYYSINEEEIDQLLSEQLCCVLKPSK